MKLKRKEKLLIISIVIVLILIIIISVVSISINKDDKLSSDDNNKQLNSNNESESQIKKLKKVSESERIRTYLGDYFNYLEDKDYESAYNLLYPKFRENYFPDIDTYKKYLIDHNYPEMYSISYNNIRIQGTYYIVNLDIDDFSNTSTIRSKSENADRTFIIKEEDYNEFYLSFKL